MQDLVTIGEMSRAGFGIALPRLVAIYAAALGATQEELPGRQSIMERHAANPDFRAIAAIAADDRIVGFAYCFRGIPGQWWHDVVRSGILARHGPGVANAWLEHVLEVAEVHVLPAYQARGIGRRMLLELTAERAERTALLSTRDAETPARKLYRSLGFRDLLTEFLFPGGGLEYAVMGARLPLVTGHAPGSR